MRLLSNLLRRFIRQGTLRVRDAEGKVHIFGECRPGPDVAIHLHDRRLYAKLFINPELYADVHAFYAKLLEKYAKSLKQEDLETLAELVDKGKAKAEIDDDIPF